MTELPSSGWTLLYFSHAIEVAIAELLETGEIGLGKPEAPFPTERKRSGEETYGYLKLSKCPGLYYLSILTRK